ncbi:MAG TPA: hypothetical protein VGQ81_15315 [Acidobacteriota bacterium]|nr:hypothetical protein [Acidobacteriota bacterium]
MLWFTGTALLVLICFRAFRKRMFPEYPPFYSYIGFVLLASLGRSLTALRFSTTSTEYYYVYYLSSLPMAFLQFWILWDLHGRIVGKTKTSWKEMAGWASVVVTMTLPIAWKVFSMPKVDFFMGFHAFTLPLQVVVCLLVCHDAYVHREVDLGRNLKGMLLGLALLVACQSINFTEHLFMHSPLQVFRFFLQFNYFVALIVFSYTLWDYVPLRRLQAADQQQFEKVNEQLEQVLKALLLR